MSMGSGLTSNGGVQAQLPAAYAPVTPPPLAANQSQLSGGNPAQGMGKSAGGGPPQYVQPAAMSGTPAPPPTAMAVPAPAPITNGGFPARPATPMAPPTQSQPTGAVMRPSAGYGGDPGAMANALRGQRGPIRG
jgi:hypothetical protein